MNLLPALLTTGVILTTIGGSYGVCLESPLTTDDAATDASHWAYFWGKGGSFGASPVNDTSSAGKRVVELDISVSEDDGYLAVVFDSKLEAGTSGVKMRINTREFPGAVSLRLRDATGESHQYPLNLVAAHDGWQEVAVDITARHAHWGGANTGVIAFPATVGLQFTPGRKASGKVLVDTIKALVEITDANRYVFRSKPTSLGNIWFQNQASVAFSVEDRLGGGEPCTLIVEIENDRAEDGFCRRVRIEELSVTNKTLTEIGFEARRLGLYHVTGTLRGAGGRIVGRIDTTGARVRPADYVDGDVRLGMNLSTATRAQSDREAYSKLAARCGVRWTRDEFSWERIEPVKGRFDWSGIDAGVSAEKSSGLKILGLIAYSAAWARRDSSKYTSPPRTVEDYAEFVYAVVNRYKGKVKHWELWNEPDSPVFWPPKPDVGEFSRLFAAGAEAAKKADPSCTVMPAGLLVGMNHRGNWKFVDDLMSLPGGKSADVIAWHAYCEPLSPEEGLYAKCLRTLAGKIGGKRIWMTEQGWPTSARPDGRSISPVAQRNYLVRAHVIAVSDPAVDSFFWFLFRDGVDRDHDYEQSFGILNPDTTPKESFPAYVAMARCIGGAKAAGIKTIGDHSQIASFCRPDGRVVDVCWSDSSAESFSSTSLGLRTGDAILDVCGNVCPIPEKGIVELTESPVYIVHKQVGQRGYCAMRIGHL